MAGVGKTVALQGLAGDAGIRARFPDGISYIRLGQDATAQAAIQQLVRVMEMTGASTSVERVKN